MQDNKCRLINEMLEAWMNYLYFGFATPVAKEFESINLSYHQTNDDPHDLSKQLVMNPKSLYGRHQNIDRLLKIMENVDFGVKFKQKICIHLANITYGSKNDEKYRIKEMQIKCLAMMQEASCQVVKILSESANVFIGLALLSQN